MREILYRAISMATGEHWLYGQPRHYAHNPHTEKWTMYDPTTGIETDIMEETLGQYTGLTDKNGTMIFEGDIVSYAIVTGGIEELVIPSNVRHEVTFDESHAAYKIGYHYACTGTMRDVVEAKNIIVMGNRWDNPELLKGGEK